MTDENPLFELRRIILRHLPTSRQKLDFSFSPLFARSDFYANDILNANEFKSALLGVSWDAPEMERLARLLGQTLATLDRMHYKTVRDIRWYAEPDDDGRVKTVMTGHDFRQIVMEARDIVRQSSRYKANLTPESKKRNWQAVSVARECRNIWAEEHWAVEHGDWGEGPAHERFLETFPPKTQNHYRPGPFGRFVEDVFECLNVLSSDGSVVTAASALSALAEWERTQNS